LSFGIQIGLQEIEKKIDILIKKFKPVVKNPRVGAFPRFLLAHKGEILVGGMSKRKWLRQPLNSWNKLKKDYRIDKNISNKHTIWALIIHTDPKKHAAIYQKNAKVSGRKIESYTLPYFLKRLLKKGTPFPALKTKKDMRKMILNFK